MTEKTKRLLRAVILLLALVNLLISIVFTSAFTFGLF